MVKIEFGVTPIGTRVELRERSASNRRYYNVGEFGKIVKYVGGSCVVIDWERHGPDPYGFWVHKFRVEDDGPW